MEVALKILHPHLAGAARSEARRRFFEEARTAAGLRHPGVVAIYDLDETTRTLVMEYVPGGTLRRLLDGGALPATVVAMLARALLDALGYVHARGIVHGDVKPSNLLLRRPLSDAEAPVVIADFGIAHLAGSALRPDAPAGTPLYLAPEQFRGAPSSPATDLYALGAILRELLAGRPMRRHADLTGQRFEAPALPDRRPPDVPELADLVRRLTATDPAARPPDTAAARALLA
jgi:eukaryotic-like serine/threonine-protein kinase